MVYAVPREVSLGLFEEMPLSQENFLGTTTITTTSGLDHGSWEVSWYPLVIFQDNT